MRALATATGRARAACALDTRGFAGYATSPMRSSVSRCLVLGVLGVVGSCGGRVGETLRPKEHTAQQALGGKAVTCEGEAKYARPLIVDLDPDARVDLEASMKSGVVVVAYDCTSLRVLTSCRLADSNYEYAGVSRKEQVVQITSADELQANLPLSQAKLSGEVQSGRSINLGLVLVGRNSTTVSSLAREELTGGCDGATHFVQNATLGAFSMVTGAVGKAAIVAEVFNYGGGAKSESERTAVNRDGSLEACRSSEPDAAAPPSESRAPLRVELVPIAAELPPAGAKKPKGEADAKGAKGVVAQDNPCPEGYKFIEGLCTRAAAQAYQCDPEDEAECQQQCDRGSAASCYNYAVILQSSKRGKESPPFFKKACEGDFVEACAPHGWNLVGDEGPNMVKANREALKVFDKACTMGSGSACAGAGDLLDAKDWGVFDRARAYKAYDRGCSLGDANSCFYQSNMLFKGDPVPKDLGKGVAVLQRACKGGDGDVCYELGRVLAGGKYGVPKDLEGALVADRLACVSEPYYCNDAARTALKLGKDAEGFKWAKRGCDGDDDEACTRLGDLYRDGRGVAKDEAEAKKIWTRACNNGEGWDDACKRIGVKMKE